MIYLGGWEVEYQSRRQRKRSRKRKKRSSKMRRRGGDKSALEGKLRTRAQNEKQALLKCIDQLHTC